jgi:hypothetical protein
MPKRPVPLIYVIVVAVIGPTLGIICTFGYVVNASKGQRAATCATIDASRAEKRAQLDAYAETPPSTEAGRNLQAKTEASLRTWNGLWQTLGCKEATNGS